LKNLNLVHITFTKKDLECIPEDEAAFLLQIGGLIHEVISLQKFIYISSHGVENPIQRMAENAQGMYFYRLLAGILFEGWNLITQTHNEYKIIIAKYKPHLDNIAKSALEKLQIYFSDKNNSCAKIRNNFSHHYNYGQIRNVLRKWPENDKFEIYLSEMHANCRYMASDIVTNLAMLGTTEVHDISPKLDTLLKEISEMARAFIDLISEYLSLILQKLIEETNIEGKEISIGSVPSLDEIRLHYFVAKPDSEGQVDS